MKKTPPSREEPSAKMRRFQAEADYADSIVHWDLCDQEASIALLKRALEWDPTYAPAILTMGSIEYQLHRRAEGRKLFQSLLSLPDTTPDLAELIDRAGDFLIDRRDYEDGLELYRAAVKKFPSVAALHQGLSCCASHQRFNDEALAAAERALQLEPDYQPFVNDLGWSLYKVGRLEEARTVLERAVSMGPSDGYARNNLRICQEEISKRSEGSGSKRKPRRTTSTRKPLIE